MLYRFQAGISAALLVGLVAGLMGCASPAQDPQAAVIPAETAASFSGMSGNDAAAVGAGTAAVVTSVVEKVHGERSAKDREVRSAAGSITIDCSVKLPDDPTENPELCRSFQMSVVDEAGNDAARFRFGNDARYRFAAKPGKKYRVKPIIGKNWEFSVEPDHDLTMGERAKVQLRQKE
jgi:hypothetical protein